MSKQKIIAYTDGACSGNPGPGGYGVVLEIDGTITEFAGREEQTTNQRMELMAAIVALENTPSGSQVVLHSDSAYLIRAWREGWLKNWQRNGWRNSKGAPVANQDLWQRLLELEARRSVQWEKVAGHAGDPRNERCDLLARMAIRGQLPDVKTEPQAQGHLLVLNKDEDTVMYVDIERHRVTKTISVAKNPHEVVVSPDGKWAYVTCSGDDLVLAIDNDTREISKRFSHPELHFPHGLAITYDGQRLLLASTYSNKFFIFCVPSLEIKHIFTSGQELVHMVALASDERYAYIANIKSNTLTHFDLEKEEIISHIPVGRGPEGVAVHPDGTVYVANQDDNDLYVLAAADQRLVQTLKLGNRPIRVAISPDGRYAFVSNRESGDLSIIDCSRQREIKRIRVGVWPGGIAFTHSGDFAYVANNKTNDISVIDVATLKEVDRIDVGIHPDGIAFFQR
mgnify:FL=1